MKTGGAVGWFELSPARGRVPDAGIVKVVCSRGTGKSVPPTVTVCEAEKVAAGLLSFETLAALDVGSMLVREWYDL